MTRVATISCLRVAMESERQCGATCPFHAHLRTLNNVPLQTFRHPFQPASSDSSMLSGSQWKIFSKFYQSPSDTVKCPVGRIKYAHMLSQPNHYPRPQKGIVREIKPDFRTVVNTYQLKVSAQPEYSVTLDRHSIQLGF